jgi:hypothetical protein
MDVVEAMTGVPAYSLDGGFAEKYQIWRRKGGNSEINSR